MIAPQQILMYLNPLQLARNSLIRSGEVGGEMRNVEEK